MKIDELSVGGTQDPTTLSGPGTTALNDPRVQAALLNTQRQNVADRRKALQDQILQMTKQLEDLKKQLSLLK